MSEGVEFVHLKVTEQPCVTNIDHYGRALSSLSCMFAQPLLNERTQLYKTPFLTNFSP